MYVAEDHILRGNLTKNNVSIYSMVRHVHLKLLMDELASKYSNLRDAFT